MDQIRFLAQLLGCLVFSLGSFRTLAGGLLNGHFSGRKGAVIGLHNAPVQYGLGLCFFLALGLFFAWLGWRLLRSGPAAQQQPVAPRARPPARAAGRNPVGPTRSAPSARPWVADAVGGVLLLAALGLALLARAARSAGGGGLEVLLYGLLGMGLAVVGLLLWSMSSRAALAWGARGLLVLLVFGSLLLK